MVAHLGKPIDFTSMLSRVTGSVRDLLVEPNKVSEDMYLKYESGRPITRLRMPLSSPVPSPDEDSRLMLVHDGDPPKSRATHIGDVPWDGIYGKGCHVYSIDGLMVTQTSWSNALIMDDRGIR